MTEFAVRMGMGIQQSEWWARNGHRCPRDVQERVLDQLWLMSVLIEQRRRIRIAERDTFNARADRVLALLDPDAKAPAVSA